MSDTKADESAKTTGFKGFDKDLKCSPNGYTQAYSVGATVEHKGEIKLCAKRVDGKRIKADTFYQLKRGKFVEVS